MSILPPPKTDIDKFALESGKAFHKAVDHIIKKSDFDDDLFFSSFEMIFDVEMKKLKKIGIVLTDPQKENTKRFFKSYYFKKKEDKNTRKCWFF